MKNEPKQKKKTKKEKKKETNCHFENGIPTLATNTRASSVDPLQQRKKSTELNRTSAFSILAEEMCPECGRKWDSVGKMKKYNTNLVAAGVSGSGSTISTLAAFPTVSKKTEQTINTFFADEFVRENPLTPAFGSPLQDVVKEDGAPIPVVVSTLCEQLISTEQIKVEGIFRVPALKSNLQKFKLLFNKRYPVNLHDESPYLVADLLKEFGIFGGMF